jgi:hypothetical protein
MTIMSNNTNDVSTETSESVSAPELLEITAVADNDTVPELLEIAALSGNAALWVLRVKVLPYDIGDLLNRIKESRGNKDLPPMYFVCEDERPLSECVASISEETMNRLGWYHHPPIASDDQDLTEDPQSESTSEETGTEESTELHLWGQAPKQAHAVPAPVEKEAYPEFVRPHLRQMKDLHYSTWIICGEPESGDLGVTRAMLGAAALWWPVPPHPLSWVLPLDSDKVDGGLLELMGDEGYEWARGALLNVELPSRESSSLMDILNSRLIKQTEGSEEEDVAASSLDDEAETETHVEEPDAPELTVGDLETQLAGVAKDTPVRTSFVGGASLYVGRAACTLESVTGADGTATRTPFVLISEAKGPAEKWSPSSTPAPPSP